MSGAGEAASPSGRVRLLALEPYHGGSHRAVLEGLLERLEGLGWETEALTLPARKWKWRMRGAAITFAAELTARHHARASLRDHTPADADAASSGGRGGRSWDVVFASTFVNLAELKGLAGEALAGVPCVVYFHENQLTYPVRHEAEWDFQFPLTNITSALAADACLFNSRHNLEGFLGGVPGLIARFPDHRPRGLEERIAEKSAVLPPPFDTAAFDAWPPRRGERCRIVWPHRWEHDKDPDAFLDAVAVLAEEGLDFEVALAGQAFRDVPESIQRAEERLGDRLAHVGEPAGRGAYAELLATSDVAVSTARNEFFGLAMAEASYAGCWPLVPDRLAYPELYPEGHRYRTPDELVARLRALVQERPPPGALREPFAAYSFERLVPSYDEVLRRMAEGGRVS